MPTPSQDGDVLRYAARTVSATVPVIYYVNGIQTTADEHARTADMMSLITQRPVFGVYNASGGVRTRTGFAADLAQCLVDWTSNVGGKVTELAGLALTSPLNAVRRSAHNVRRMFGSDAPPPATLNLLVDARRLLPEGPRVALVEARIGLYNRATLALYRRLRAGRHARQIVIAHSQGNLITADALWAMVYTFGEESLDQVRVYSLASPSPAWPLGIRRRRKVYGFKNDAVTLADPHNWTAITGWFAGGAFNRTAGDWRRYGHTPLARVVPGLDPHDLSRNAYLLNFANGIRRDLELPPIPVPPDVR